MAKKKNEGQPPPAPHPVIRYAPLGQLNVYQVTEHELDLLAQGGQGSLLLNFALFMLGIAATVFATLWSTAITPDRVYVTYLTVGLVTGIGGVVLFVLWLNTYRSATGLITGIKNRMPPALPIEQLPFTPPPPPEPGVETPPPPPSPTVQNPTLPSNSAEEETKAP